MTRQIHANLFLLALLSCLLFATVIFTVSKDHVHPSGDHSHKYRHDGDDMGDGNIDDGDGEEHHDGVLDGEEQERFKDLTPEESRNRLGKLVDKMDIDKDGFVNEDELSQWIKKLSMKYLEDDRDKQWKTFKIQNDLLSFNEYLDTSYGIQDETQPDESLKRLKERDERRWLILDSNKDGKLSKEEFLKFLHPEEFPELHGTVVEETMADLDKDHDGKISLDEYLQDLWQPSEGSSESEPQWLNDERTNFAQQHDKNNDGYLDQEEVRQWILPADYDHVKSEVQYLFEQADVNKDKLLSKAEIVEKYDAFVGSQATQFGDHLKVHEEL